MTRLDRIIAAGYVVRLSWVPSRQQVRALATEDGTGRVRNIVPPTVRLDAYGATAREATQRLYAAMVSCGAVQHEELPPGEPGLRVVR